MYQEKIEFYKNRTIGERFSVAGDFIRQNWKVLLKNIGYVGAPLALLQGYFSQRLIVGLLSYNFTTPYANINWPYYLLLFPFSFLLFLFFFSMTGSILNKYIKGSLTEETGWADLKGQLFSFAGKIFLQGLILFLAIFVIAVIIGVFAGFLSLGTLLTDSWTGIFITIILVFLISVLLFCILMPLMLIPYPLFFEDASAWQGIKKGCRLGFKYWGSTFLTVFLGCFLSNVVSYILTMPYMVYLTINAGENSFLGYVLAMFSSLVGIIVFPVFIIFLSFQYTSIVEKEEGVSLQDKIEGFDNL
jgi:hypothetical protein